MSSKYINTKYEAQGFVEALIAIVVAGMATIVLMSIAINTLNGVVRNEMLDQMTQEAVKGGELISHFVDEYNYQDVGTLGFLPLEPTDYGDCYALDGDVGSLYISSAPLNDGACKYQDNGSGTSGFVPNACLVNAGDVKINESAFTVNQNSDESDLFRIMCIHPESDSKVLVAKVIVGNMSCRNLNTLQAESLGIQKDCNIYEYTSVHFLKTL
jgi:hypothetical protein